MNMSKRVQGITILLYFICYTVAMISAIDSSIEKIIIFSVFTTSVVLFFVVEILPFIRKRFFYKTVAIHSVRKIDTDIYFYCSYEGKEIYLKIFNLNYWRYINDVHNFEEQLNCYFNIIYVSHDYLHYRIFKSLDYGEPQDCMPFSRDEMVEVAL